MPFEIKSQTGIAITSVDEWQKYAPPAKANHWREYRSAMESAKSYFRTGTAAIPKEITDLLDQCPETRGFEYSLGIPEKKIKLDSFSGPRNSDMCLYGTRGEEKIAVGIEAKADEPFSETTISEALANGLATPKSNIPARVRQLSKAIFGDTFDPTSSTLRYQLLYSVAGALLDAKRHGADVCAFIVHVFNSRHLDSNKVSGNASDYGLFVRRLHGFANGHEVDLEILHPPCRVPGDGAIPSDIPLLMGKATVTLD